MTEPSSRPERRPVLIVCISKRFGGSDVRVIELAEAMAGDRPLTVAVFAGSKLEERLDALGVDTLPIERARSDGRISLDLRQAARRLGPGVVVDAHNPQSQLWSMPAASAAGAPLLFTVHSEYRQEHEDRRRSIGYEAVLRLGALAGATFLAVSPSVRDYVARLTPAPRRLATIANGVGIPDRPVDPPDEAPFTILTAGRLEPIKGHATLLEALASGGPGLADARVRIAGEGRAHDALEAQATRLGITDRVDFLGFCEDVSAEYEQAHVFCMPSLSEGLPYALLEACAAGLPSVVSAVGGMRELLTDGETGVLVPPSEPAALAAALERLAADRVQSRRIGLAGRALVEARHDVRVTVAQTAQLYDALESWVTGTGGPPP